VGTYAHLAVTGEGSTLSRQRAYSTMPCGRERGFSGLPWPPLEAGVFLPSGPCGPSEWFLFQVLPGDGSDPVPDIIFRCSPLTSWPCLAVGAALAPLFLDPIERIGHSFRSDHSNLWTVPQVDRLIYPSSLVFPVYRGRQEFFRVLPFSFCYPLWQALTRGSSMFFPCTGWARASHWEFR